MSGFTALNVEPEDNLEEEIDDTREIQLEEAFKLYQNALKLHSQGPQYFQEARIAYDDLLKSEIFKYPEVVSEFAHDELDDDATIAASHADVASLSLLPSNAAESSASSIPQLIYLTFKNRGQFLLDVARHQLSRQKASRSELSRFYAQSCKESLKQFAQALERDDTDLDLWKKAARISEVLSSQRLARFCLESVLAGEDEDGQQTVDVAGLDEAFAAGELEEVVQLVEDDLTRLQSTDVRPKDKLLAALKKSNDPYRFLPKRTKTLEYLDDKYRPLSFGVAPEMLKPVSSDLHALGDEIARVLESIQSQQFEEGSSALSCATAVKVILPESVLTTDDLEMSIAVESPTNGVHIDEVEPHAPVQNDSHNTPTQNDAQVESPAEITVSRNEDGEGSGTALQEVGDRMDMALDGDTIEVRSAAPPRDETGATTRKRSSTIAGNDEPEGRTKSKRLRARESMADLAAQEEETIHEDPRYFLDQLAYYEQADQATFDVVNSLLDKFNLKLYLTTEEARQAFWTESEEVVTPGASEATKKDLVHLADLRRALIDWTDEKGHAIIHGHSVQDFPEKSAGISQFLQRSKLTSPKKSRRPEDEESGKVALKSLVSFINNDSTNIHDAAIYWFYSIFTGAKLKGRLYPSPYLLETWSADMRRTTTKLLCQVEDHLWRFLNERLSSLSSPRNNDPGGYSSEIRSTFELVESVFEIYLDLAHAALEAEGEEDQTSLSINGDRLKRWGGLAGDFMQLYLLSSSAGMSDPLVLRFIWTSVSQARIDDNVDKAHIVLLLEEMKAFMEKNEAESIYLPNNAAMPEISVIAIEHQLSVLSTSDFFTRVFDDDNSDPVAVIEMLEPMLDSITQSQNGSSIEPITPTGHSSQANELVKFLESHSATLTLALWRRLQNAYTSISYSPKVVSSLLRIIETIESELCSSRHLDLDTSSRQIDMLKWLKDINDIIIKLLPKITTEPHPFECIDEAHLQSSLRAVSRIVKLLYGFIIYDDSVRVGQTTGPQFKGTNATKLYEKSKDRLKEMLIHTWTLQYMLLKEATVQDPSSYTRAADDLAEYLCTVHNSFGVRQYCKYLNKSFVKLVKAELNTLPTNQDYAAEVAQVFYDLYQLRFASGIGDGDHGCPPDNLDKKTAWTLIPTIMKYAERFNVKDLNKSELKGTIDKMQAALGAIKSPPTVLQNKRIVSDYLKSIIKAVDLFRCTRGILALPTSPVRADTDIAASSGWYFMLGHLTLSKFKAIKRVNPTSTEDLDLATQYLRHDLNHDSEKWETWYRLAQCFEAKIEDDLIWNSAKLNDSRGDIALLERQAIHSYMMATAIAFRTMDDRIETAKKIEDMLGEFGTRLYASSRPPLDMEAFKTDKHMRHLSSTADQTMSKQPYHKPVREFPLWCFAAHLLNTKLTDRPKPWILYYTRAKCLWKILRNPENRGRVSAEHVIRAIVDAIEALPKKEKTNEPILEPHLKLVSVVHKMLRHKMIDHSQGYEYMQATRYAHGIHLSQDEGDVDWERYMLDILKKLSHADKANWHHRITNRAAHVLYDDSLSWAGALGAKHEFTQQIFTKTMVMQVWKPENERPGRHYVYTGRYVLFFVHILEQLSDRTSLDSLVRRIRRKVTDFLDHGKIWEEAATTYVRMLRRYGSIPENRERALFDGMNYEEFTKKSEAMEKWSHDQSPNSVYLEVMREATDLKRLNNSLMKGPVIDDLIGDAYACLYEEFVKQLPPEEQPKPQPAPLPQGTFINMTTDLAGTADEEAERVRLNNMLRAQGDGSADGPLAVSISAPVGLGLQNSPTPFPAMPGQPVPEVQRERAKPGRTKTVTRREIQRKAEAAIVKPPPIKTPILSKRLAVEVPLKNENDLGSPSDKRLLETKEHDVDDSRATSRRGSIQDSADGDADAEDSGSELSELEDMDEEKKQMLADFENAQENADQEDAEDSDEDAGDEAADEAADDAGGEAAKDEQGEGDDEDEEMHDAEDDIEIADSQENADNVTAEDNKQSPGDDDQEFHEAREDNVETVD